MRPRVTSIAKLASAGMLVALSGCPDREISALPLDPAKVERKEIPRYPELDLLFVVDSSGSMKGEQDSLKTNFQKFIDILQGVEGGLPSLHLGVISSDLGTQGGKLIDGCTARGDDGAMRWPGHSERFLRDVHSAQAGERERNYTGTLAAAFSEMATVGTAGCGFEAHLGALQRSLHHLDNSGFFRPAAYLAIVVIADEDDCSVRAERAAAFFAQPDLPNVRNFACFRSSTVCDGDPSMTGVRTGCRPKEPSAFHWSVDELIREVKSFKEEQETIVAGIYGPTSPFKIEGSPPQVTSSCPDTSNDAMPAVRLEKFVTAFRNHALASICSSDLSMPIQQIATLVSNTVKDAPCLRSIPARPFDCTVADVIDPRGPNRQVLPLPQCNGSNTPCWELEEHDLCKATPSKLRLHVNRGTTSAPAGSRVIAECAVAEG